jgi:preprotein translocase subunit Sss1
LRLRALETRGAPAAEDADNWFVELSSIVRAYVEQRYRIRAPELTTEEFLQVAVAAAAMSDEQRALLTQFLERCDRVKFAGYRPDAEESITTLKAARGFVEDTRLREDATGAATAQKAAA